MLFLDFVFTFSFQVLRKAQAEMIDYGGTGVSVMGMCVCVYIERETDGQAD